jgi:hypothetical protein
MSFARILVLSASALAVASAYADTSNTNKPGGKAEVQRKASPSAPKTDEERTQTHSQPDVPHPSGGATAPSGATAQSSADRTQAFKSLDIDGDGLVSKAEAAGNAEVTAAFDRGDRNRDGKLSAAEYERYTRLQARAAAKKKQAVARKNERSASAGGSAPKPAEK